MKLFKCLIAWIVLTAGLLILYKYEATLVKFCTCWPPGRKVWLAGGRRPESEAMGREESPGAKATTSKRTRSMDVNEKVVVGVVTSLEECSCRSGVVVCFLVSTVCGCMHCCCPVAQEDDEDGSAWIFLSFVHRVEPTTTEWAPFMSLQNRSNHSNQDRWGQRSGHTRCECECECVCISLANYKSTTASPFPTYKQPSLLVSSLNSLLRRDFESFLGLGFVVLTPKKKNEGTS